MLDAVGTRRRTDGGAFDVEDAIHIEAPPRAIVGCRRVVPHAVSDPAIARDWMVGAAGLILEIGDQHTVER